MVMNIPKKEESVMKTDEYKNGDENSKGGRKCDENW